jgi:hypothetical protein
MSQRNSSRHFSLLDAGFRHVLVPYQNQYFFQFLNIAGNTDVILMAYVRRKMRQAYYAATAPAAASASG